MKKVYLASPVCFKKNAIQQYGYMSSYLLDLGFLALVPIDNECADALEIKKANCQMIITCDYVLADITPFRGVSCDVGTAYEIGMAESLGKEVILYSSDRRAYKDRVEEDGMIIENFNLCENLMIQGSNSVWGSFEDAVKYLKGVS